MSGNNAILLLNPMLCFFFSFFKFIFECTRDFFNLKFKNLLNSILENITINSCPVFAKILSRLIDENQEVRTMKSIRSPFDIELKIMTLQHTSCGYDCIIHTVRSRCCNLHYVSTFFHCVQINLFNQPIYYINEV